MESSFLFTINKKDNQYEKELLHSTIHIPLYHKLYRFVSTTETRKEKVHNVNEP